MQKLLNDILNAHPYFLNEIKGVSDEEVQKLEELSSIQLPNEYKLFLSHMGLSLGRIHPMTDNSTTNVEINISYNAVFKELYYRKNMPEKKRNRFLRSLQKVDIQNINNFLLISINPTGNDAGHYYIDLTSTSLRIVEITETFGATERSPSFIEFLFKKYFRREVSIYMHQMT